MPLELTDGDIDDMIRRYQAGVSARAIAHERGISTWSVRKALTARGVPVRNREQAHSLRAAANIQAAAIDDAALVRNYLEGQSIRSLSDRYGATGRAVKAILSEHDIPIRGQKQSVVTAGEKRRRIPDAAVDDIVRRYQAGESTTSIALDFEVPVRSVYKQLERQGVPRKVELPEDDIVAAYRAGESALALGAKYGVSGAAIKTALARNNVPTRGQSAAGMVRASRMTVEERRRVAEAAAERSRGRQMPAVVKAKMAAGKERNMSQRVGAHEEKVADVFCDAGFEVARQKAVGFYNIDIAAGSVAVEIHTSPHGPHLPRGGRIYRRVDDLTNQGWKVLYVWCPRGINADDLEQVVALAKELQLQPATPGEYTVFRCRGDYAPARGGDAYHGAFVVSTGSGLHINTVDRRVAG